MADDRLNSIADVPEIEGEIKQIETAITDLVAFVKTKREELKGTEFTLFDTSSSKESTTAIKQGKKQVDELTISLKEYEKLTNRLAITEGKLAAAQSDTAKQLASKNVELAAVNKELKQAAIVEQQSLTATQKMTAAVAAASAQYKELAYTKGLDAKATQDALKRYNDLQGQVVKVNTAMGNYRDNVGNYSSATANLGRNLGIISGELPNLAQSWRIFAMSVGNNITPVVNDIAALRKENVALVASGKPAVSIAKAFGNSLKSVQTITGLVVAGGIALVNYLSTASKETEKLKEKTDDLTDSRKEQADAIAREVAEMKSLSITAANPALSYTERGEAVDELQKKFPEYFSQLSREKILNGDVAAATDLATEAIKRKALETARLTKYQKSVSDLADLQLQLEQMTSKQAGVTKYYTADQLKTIKDKIKLKETEVAGLEQGLKTQNNINANEAYWLDANAKRQYEANQQKEKANALLTEEQRKMRDAAAKSAPKEAERLERERLAALKKQSEDTMQVVFDQMNNIALAETQIQDKQLNDLIKDLEDKKITFEEYGNKKELIVRATEDRILQYQIQSLKDYLKIAGLQPDEIAKVEERITDLTKKEIDKRRGEREAAATQEAKQAETTEKNLAGFRAAMAKKNDENLKKYHDDRVKREKQYLQIAREAAAIIYEAFSQAYQSRIDKLEKINESIDKNTTKEVEAVRLTTVAEDEKARRISEIEARAAAKKAINERKAAEIKQKQARLEKAIALVQIAAETAKNIVSAYPNPILIAAAAALGAAQIAVVAARPIPQYAEGTTDHIGGKAILGDGDERELVIEPNKKPYWSADTDTLYNLPKHTQVIPESKLNAYASGTPSNRDVVNAVYAMTGQLGYGLNKIDKSIRSKEAVSIQGKNRRWENYYYENTRK